MEDSILWILVIVVLVALSAFFSGTETAFSSVSKVRLKNYASSGDKRAKRALKVADRFDTALSALLVGNNIVNISAASVGTLIFTRLMGEAGVGLSTVVLTVVVLIFGEVVPKSLAKRNPEGMAIRAAGPLLVLMKVFFPVIWLLQQIVKLFSKRMGKHAKPTVTEEELKYIIEEIEDEGVMNEHESELVQSAIDFDDITADEILTPRVDVTAVDITDDCEKIKKLFFDSGYTRLPVYEKNIDNIIGVLNEKDFIQAYLDHPPVDIQPILQKVVLVPPKKRISELMKELQRDKLHLAVVTDSYGGTLGIVTLEDIIEELVGEIWDESDEVEPEITRLNDGLYRVSGDMNVYDLFDELEVEDSDYDGPSQSMSGWALDVFEKIPEKNERFAYRNLQIIVEQVEEQRIISFLVKVCPVEPGEEED